MALLVSVERAREQVTGVGIFADFGTAAFLAIYEILAVRRRQSDGCAANFEVRTACRRWFTAIT